MTFGCFGCALDALDAPEKMAMKLAYLGAKAEGLLGEGTARDPYDLLTPLLADIPDLRFVGKLEIESFLTPRPGLEDADMVHPEVYRQFADQDGCAVLSSRVSEFVRQRVLPLRPLMIGVDHSLTGGVLRALSAGSEPLAMVVMDAHLDAIPTSVRWKAGMALEGAEAAVAPAGEPPADLYTCGTWLTSIIDEGVISAPDVLVMGVGDYPSEPQPGEKEGLAAYREAYRSLEGRGVRVLTRRTMREEGIGTAVTRALSGVEGKPLYVSIDADFAAGERVRAVRFLDMLGLTPQEAVEAARAVGSALTGGSNRLAGVDVMEIDVHGADIPGGSDRTIPVSSEIVHALLRR